MAVAWPTPALGIRPAHYYTKQAVAEFIRHRPYVHSILSLELDPGPTDKEMASWRYLTSAPKHDLSGETASAPKRPRMARPASVGEP